MGRSNSGFHPPVSRFRIPASFWCQTFAFQIWFQTVKTGGATGENVVFSLFWSFSELVLFHVYIFLAFYCIEAKVGRVVPCSMLFNFLNVEGHTVQVT